jgi:hypothetical protein
LQICNQNPLKTLLLTTNPSAGTTWTTGQTARTAPLHGQRFTLIKIELAMIQQGKGSSIGLTPATQQ